MTTTVSPSSLNIATGARPPRVVRRSYISDPKRQLRTAILTTSLVLVLLVFVNLGFHLLRASQTSILSAAAPQLKTILAEQDSTRMLVMISISVVLMIMVFIVTIVETHRTAGAVVAMRQRLERVRDGDYHISLKFRHRDNLKDLEDPFNEMVATLRKRADDDAAVLDELAVRAESIGNDGEGLSRALRDFAESKRF